MKISIVGAGWLGLPLALTLTQSGHSIVATKRSEQSAQELKQQGIDCLVYELGDDLERDELAPLFNCDWFVLNIPPGRKHFNPEEFKANMQGLIQHARNKQVENILFVSTSAVYGDASRTVYEYSPLAPLTDSAKAHAQLESQVKSTFGQNATILRLAGLVGKDRHPAKFLSAKTQVANGQQSINLVHLDDVLKIIVAIIDQQASGQTYHLSSQIHPRRDIYYPWACQHLGLTGPDFLPVTSQATGKIVDCALTLSSLGVELSYPSPYDMLNDKT